MREARGWVRGLIGVALVLAPFSLVVLGILVLMGELRRRPKVAQIDTAGLSLYVSRSNRVIGAMVAQRLFAA